MKINGRCFRGEKLSYNWLNVIIIFISFLTLNSCKENPVVAADTTPDNATIIITPKYFKGYIHQRFKFTSLVTHTDSTKPVKVSWLSGDSTIVSIDSTGICLFKKKGNVNIYAKVISTQGATLALDTAYVTSDSLYFKFYQRDLHLTSLDNYQVSYNYVPFKVKLASSNNSVVTVDSMGNLGIKSLGFSYISATVIDSLNVILARDSIKVSVEWWKKYSLQSKITSMAYNHTQNSIFVGTGSGNGIYTSPDDGTTWSQSNSGLSLNSNTSVTSIALSQSNPEEVIAVLNYSYIAVSQDRGATWQSAPSPGPEIQDVEIEPDDDNVVYAIGRYIGFQIYKSTDKCSSWNKISEAPDPSGEAPKLYIDPTNPQKMYIGGHGSYISTDAGVVWNMIDWPSHGTEFLLSNIDIRGNIYVQDYNWDGSLKLRLVRSDDYGSTFTVLNEYSNNTYVYGSDFITGNTICCASPNTVYVSTNNGQSWDQINGIFPSPPTSWSAGIAVTNSNPPGFIYSININGFGQIWKYKEAK